MGRHIVLLRGINVGGKNKLPMAELRSLCEELGARDVRTYIQSGNVVAAGGARWAKTFADKLRGALATRYDYDVPVVMLEHAELAAILAGNPFLAEVTDPKSLHVYFLSATPSTAKVEALDAERSPGDRFAVRGRAIYLHLPNGMARTKLGNLWFERQLGVIATARNWRTTVKLMALGADDG